MSKVDDSVDLPIMSKDCVEDLQDNLPILKSVC